jgi:fluoroquinolone transport system permease protein
VSRLLAALRTDARLQLRHGFYTAGAVVAGFWVLLLGWLPAGVVEGGMVPFLFLNLLIASFYFVAGLVLFEKGEGVLEALVTTPLRDGEYLASKILTLVVLGALESLAIVALVYPAGVAWLPLALGIALTAALYTLCGFVAIARYDSINEFLLPSGLFVMVVQLPVLDFVGLWESPIFWLWPTQACLVLLEAAFRPVGTTELAYGVVYAGSWTAALFLYARVSFRRFIVRREGVR